MGNHCVVDIDLEKFFDRVNHDILMGRIAKRVADKRCLKLVRAFLTAGVMESISSFLVKKLKLRVNGEKSAVAKVGERGFLGFSFLNRKGPKRRIAPKAIILRPRPPGALTVRGT